MKIDNCPTFWLCPTTLNFHLYDDPGNTKSNTLNVRSARGECIKNTVFLQNPKIYRFSLIFKNLGLPSLRFRSSLGKPQKDQTLKFQKVTEFALLHFQKSWIIVASLPHQSRKASKTPNAEMTKKYASGIDPQGMNIFSRTNMLSVLWQSPMRNCTKHNKKIRVRHRTPTA